MYIQNLLSERLLKNNPVKVVLIGAGKFGSMFLSQVPTTPGINVVAIADLFPDKAKNACKAVGWNDELISSTKFFESGKEVIELSEIEVVIEATGLPSAGIEHARHSFKYGKHIIMVNVEADVLAGGLLTQEAKSAGVVYSMAYGDQPALTAEIIDWARSIGFYVSSAGKGTKYLPEYHKSTPDTVWNYYGISNE